MEIIDIKYAGENALNYLIGILKSGYVNKQGIVDNCASNDTDKPLSAKQGKVLQDKITEIDRLVDIATMEELELYLNTGKIVLISASITGSSANGAELGNYGLGTRATLVIIGGTIQLKISATGEVTNYSLIPIPVGATSIVVSGTKDFHFGVSIFAIENGTKYTQQLDSGWIDMTSDSGTFTIPSSYADGNYALSINFRLDSYGNFSAENYADVINARFNYN